MANRGIVYKTNSVFRWLEKIKVIEKTPNIIEDYEQDYPHLSILEENYEDIRKECEQLLKKKEQITDVKSLMGDNTAGGIHVIKWKSFMIKSGVLVKENCTHCPVTAATIAKIPKVRTAFFSILDPNQYITPHEGYFDGFMRFHLGVIIPNNNAYKECWIRVTNGVSDKKKMAELGDTYYWSNGKGVLFNDNYTHDASNSSDEIRVILWLDIERKLPLLLSWLNTLMLNIAYSTEGVKKVARNSVVKFS